MAPRATPKVPAPLTEHPDRVPTPAPPRAVRLRDGRGLTDAIADLIAERRTIRRRVASGTGMSDADDTRLRAIDIAIDRMWADLRRQRLPLPRLPTRPTARQ